MKELSNLELAVTLSYPVVGIQTFETTRCKGELIALADKTDRHIEFVAFQQGLNPNSLRTLKSNFDKAQSQRRKENLEPFKSMIIADEHFFARSKQNLETLPGLQSSLDTLEGEGFTYIIAGKERLKEEYIYYVELPPMNEADYYKAIDFAEETLSNYSEGNIFDDEERKLIVNHARGLSFTHAKNTMINAAYRKIKDMEYLASIDEQKAYILRDAGLDILKPIPMGSVGGLDNLKQFVSIRKAGMDQGLPVKGILLAGVPGAGKTLISKAIASEFGTSLVSLDMSRFYSKFVGETEGLFRRALKTIEEIAPVVVLIDEIEKYFGNTEGDHEVTQRLLGTFLTWLQDRKPGIFMVATCNKAHLLPPEMIRAGRWDRSFFVDLPNEEERQVIFEIHLKKRGIEGMGESSIVTRLAKETQGYTGSEIEQICVDATFLAAEAKSDVTEDHIFKAIEQVTPTIKMRPEEIRLIQELTSQGFYPANEFQHEEKPFAASIGRKTQL